MFGARERVVHVDKDASQMMAHANKMSGHSITSVSTHGSINPLGVGSIVIIPPPPVPEHLPQCLAMFSPLHLSPPSPPPPCPS